MPRPVYYRFDGQVFESLDVQSTVEPQLPVVQEAPAVEQVPEEHAIQFGPAPELSQQTLATPEFEHPSANLRPLNRRSSMVTIVFPSSLLTYVSKWRSPPAEEYPFPGPPAGYQCGGV